jgi:hypothetical protein
MVKCIVSIIIQSPLKILPTIFILEQDIYSIISLEEKNVNGNSEPIVCE